MTNLYSYVFRGTPLVDIPHWTINQLEGNAPFIASDVLPSGTYTDVSSINNWRKYGTRTSKDYKFIRNEIKLLANAGSGWVSLTATEKNISAVLFVVNQSRRSELFTIEQQIKQGFGFHGRSIKARDQRWSFAEMELMNRLDKDEWRIMFDDLIQDDLVAQYINNGLEGTLEDDPAGLFDYIDARSGTPYGTGSKGFRNKGFANADALADIVLDIIKNGNY